MKIQNFFMAIIVALFVVACTQQSAPEVTNYNGQRLTIAAEATPGAFNSEIVVKINGKTVVKERSRTFGGSSQTFNGVWEGKPVQARATQVHKLFSSYLQIDVFINGTLVETLTV